MNRFSPSSFSTALKVHRLLACIFASATMAAFCLDLPAARAEKMDSDTHTIVIEKLAAVLGKAKEDQTLSMRPIRARLADLYAERARLRAMEESAANCQNCTGAREDRARALKLYDVVVREATSQTKGTTMMQMAHLDEMQLDEQKAAAIYEAIIKGGSRNYSRDLIAQAYADRGELYFGKGQYAKAKPAFEASMRYSESTRQGYLAYRVAWCELNLGAQQKAVQSLIHILRTPALLTRASTNGPQIDVSFQEDVARDLASFLAHGVIARKEIDLLAALSPADSQRDNVRLLANECERLGARPAALLAWDAFIETNASSDDRLEAMIHVAQIRFEMNRRADALKGLQLAAAHWAKYGCVDDPAECENMRLHFRKMVIDWNHLEKKKPTELLLAAYKAYLVKFDKDIEMTQWAALVAREIKASGEASQLFVAASNLAAAALAAKTSFDGSAKTPGEQELKAGRELLEAALVGAIEMAELSKNRSLRQAAYEHYLQLNPNGEKSLEVRYQRARIPYEAGNSPAASASLYEFATSSDCRALGKNAEKETASGGGAARKASADLCVKAADLDLDALATIKQDQTIQAHATEFASIYPRVAVSI